ncbi:ty3-gypsy retrotransposon protein [Tanacetum coccineum]
MDISRITTEYFTLLNILVDQRLRVVGFNLEGDAAEWFRWMTRNKLITSWKGFLESVQNRFDPFKYEDPQGALSKLLQTGTIAQYQSEFEKLMNRVTDISEGLLISFYVSGLKPSLQRELLVSKPTSLGDAFALARQTMEFTWSDKGYLLRVEEALRMKRISLHHMQALLETNDVYGVYELYHMDTETTEQGNLSGNTTLSCHPELISRFETLFQSGDYSDYRASDSLEYLGHIISGRGVKVDPKKVSAVSGWPVLTSQRQVRIFLGLAGYYRRFIKNYATVVAPLSNLLQKNGFKWGKTEGKAFNELEDKLTHAPILGLSDFEDTFVIEADASDVGIGVVLLQKGQPLGYFSRKLGPRMRVAATYQKELFAIVEAVYKWRQYLLGRRFIIRNDHRSIKELMQQVIQTPLQQKYVRKLMGFDFGIEYKSGASNLVADALLRVHEDDDEVTSAFMALSRPVVGLLEDLKRENETLDELCQLHRRLDQGESIEGFQREQGLLLFRGKYFIGVESKLKDLLLSEFLMSTWMAFGGNTHDLGSFGEETDEITDLHQIHEEILFSERGDGVAGIKRRRRDPSSDGVRDLVTASGRGRLNEDLESST